MRRIWAIADLHLSFGIPNKGMEVFGEHWDSHPEKVSKACRERIGEEDLVLLPGDHSWAMRLEEAAPDLEWIHSLPGHKVICRGNHDYWWASRKKMNAVLPPSIQVLHNNALLWHDIALAGTRLWDDPAFHFNDYIDFRESAVSELPPTESTQGWKLQQAKIFDKEIIRLENSLKAMDQEAELRIALTHYPPVNAHMQPSRASHLLEKYNVDICVFGHLHSVKKSARMFGKSNGIRYVLCSCDYLDFEPVLLTEHPEHSTPFP